MNGLHRVFLCALAAPALLLDTCATHPDLAARLGLDVWNVPEMRRQIERGRGDLARADEVQRLLRERIESRGRVVDELRLGRIGLLEAAARFRDLNAVRPDGARDLPRCCPGDSEQERCCRQVISWVRGRPEGASAEAAGLPDKLEEELRERLGRDGTVRLPW
jgi:hypothetical protein